MSFGENLEHLRKRQKLSQANLGKALGITQQMISSYEKNISSPNIDSLIKLSDYFKVSIDYLVDHNVEQDDAMSPCTQLKSIIDNFSAEDINRCLLILNSLLLFDHNKGNGKNEDGKVIHLA